MRRGGRRAAPGAARRPIGRRRPGGRGRRRVRSCCAPRTWRAIFGRRARVSGSGSASGLAAAPQARATAPRRGRRRALRRRGRGVDGPGRRRALTGLSGSTSVGVESSRALRIDASAGRTRARRVSRPLVLLGSRGLGAERGPDELLRARGLAGGATRVPGGGPARLRRHDRGRGAGEPGVRIDDPPRRATAATAFAPGSILVVPLAVASGVRMKILEAWARGVAVVAQPRRRGGARVGERSRARGRRATSRQWASSDRPSWRRVPSVVTRLAPRPAAKCSRRWHAPGGRGARLGRRCLRTSAAGGAAMRDPAGDHALALADAARQPAAGGAVDRGLGRRARGDAGRSASSRRSRGPRTRAPASGRRLASKEGARSSAWCRRSLPAGRRRTVSTARAAWRERFEPRRRGTTW